MLKYLLILRHFLGNQGCKNTLFNLQRSLLHKKNKYQIKCEENAEHSEARNIEKIVSSFFLEKLKVRAQIER